MDWARRDLLRTRWPWRAAAWLVTGIPVGLLVATVAVVLVVLGVAGLPVLVGVPILLGAGLLGLPVGALERRRLRLLGERIADPHRDPDTPGLRAWLTRRYREAATWRELAQVLLLGVLWPLDLLVVACLLALPASLLGAPLVQARYGEVKVVKAVLLVGAAQAWAAVPVGLLALAAAGYLLTGYARLRSVPVRALLAGRPDEVREVARSRARLVDAFDAERRRIERDLHDGAQQRLVALGMTLGLARIADPAELPALVERAHTETGLVLAELRELIRGIHPRVLTDRGLSAAVAELADRAPVPVDVRVDLPHRLADPVEACAYFVVAEALTNVARHSTATRVRVTGRLDRHRLVLDVSDDGAGGADPTRGTGLTGLADRVAALAGVLTLDSPPGGPTLLHVELPCAPSPDPSA